MGCKSIVFIFILVILTKECVQRQHGWRVAKRPGVDYFLAYLSQFYEIVIFTSQYSYVRVVSDRLVSDLF